MIDRDKIKLFIDLFIRTHIGVGVAVAVCAVVVGYVYSSGCGPVIVAENYAEPVDWDIATARELPTEAHGADEHAADDHAEGESH